jgi:hypothetical protein
MIGVLDLSLAPGAIARLVEWLLGNGYEVTEQRSSDPNNQYTIFAAGDLLVKVSATRGEWSLGIGMWGQTFHPQQWEAWPDGYPLAGDLNSIDRQVEFISQRWGTAVDQARDLPEAKTEVTAIGDDWVKRRFGFRPPDPAG